MPKCPTRINKMFYNVNIESKKREVILLVYSHYAFIVFIQLVFMLRFVIFMEMQPSILIFR